MTTDHLSSEHILMLPQRLCGRNSDGCAWFQTMDHSHEI